MAVIERTAPDDHVFSAYENRPDGARAGIVVIQEIFGVNPHIRSVVDRYAAAGYHAVAPALFDRAERGVELQYDEAGIDAGRALATSIAWEEAVADVCATADYLSETGPVGVVGYCYGGALAWSAASSCPIQAAVGYYGGRIAALVDDVPAVPTMLHFGELDHAIPLEDVRKIDERHPDIPVYVYEGAEHGFNCDARASFHGPSAELARERTMAFFENTLLS